MYKYLIFDFDGTIANSEQVINEIVDELAARYRLKNLSHKEFKHRTDLTLMQKLRLCWFMLRANREFKNLYGERISAVWPFPHMIEAISGLHEAGYQIAIITSNRVSNVVSFLKANHFSFDIEVFTSKSLFGKHKIIRQFIDRHHCKANEVLYFGDEIRDIMACKKANVEMAFVKWGLDGAEELKGYPIGYLIDSPEELLGIKRIFANSAIS